MPETHAEAGRVYWVCLVAECRGRNAPVPSSIQCPQPQCGATMVRRRAFKGRLIGEWLWYCPGSTEHPWRLGQVGAGAPSTRGKPPPDARVVFEGPSPYTRGGRAGARRQRWSASHGRYRGER